MKICLDPGHGEGYNPSPCGFGYAEGTRMYELSLILAEELEKYKDSTGEAVTVVNTRKNIRMSPSLYDRAATAKGCDLLLSLHSNAVGNGISNGTDYVAVFHSIYDKDKAFAEAMAKAIAETMGTKQRPQALTKINGAGNADYYGIIRHAQTFGVRCLLLEQSFHTNSATTKWLMNDANLRRLAAAEAAQVANEYNLTKEDEEMRYYYLKEVPKVYREETLDRLIDLGFIKGKGGVGEDLIIDLGEDAIRLMIYHDRMGLYPQK
ncbi:MAG: N-acetylmuramoyl-L-alanine amidase [Ruminococcaceae bacterium]|nr:N-acetylmuramoyl-L-alanine amidase [Oscillospiraceae bacterium]